MRKILLSAFLLCVSGAMSESEAWSVYGHKNALNHSSHRYEDYCVKIDKDSSLTKIGDVINFDIRGKGKGKLEVFSIKMNKEKNMLFIKVFDLTNKINRTFDFPLE